MKFFSILLAASLIIVVGCSGRTETEKAIISANEENTSFTTIEKGNQNRAYAEDKQYD